MRLTALVPALTILATLTGGCGEEKKKDVKNQTKPATSDPAADDGVLPAARLVDCAGIAPDHVVTIYERTLSHSPLLIHAGETVAWENLDSLPHTVTNGSAASENAGALFDSGELMQGEKTCVQFNQPGYFEYFCTTHQEDSSGGGVDVRTNE